MSRAAAPLLALALVWPGGASAADPPKSLNGSRMPATWIVTAGGGGTIVAFDRADGAILRWRADGTFDDACRVTDPRVDLAAVQRLGATQRFVFVGTLSGGGVEVDATKAFLIDRRSCDVRHEVPLPNPPMAVESLTDGWIVKTLPSGIGDEDGKWPGCDVVRVDESGKLHRDRVPPKGLAEGWKGRGNWSRACGLGRVVEVHGLDWLTPTAAYEFWRPRQRGLGEAKLVPPSCLAASERVLEGDEARAEATARFADASEEARAAVEAAFESGGVSIHVPAVSAAASDGDLAVVGVHVVENGVPGCRYDVWDLALKRVMTTIALPGSRCNRYGFVSLGGGGLWALDSEQSFVRLPLPEVLEPTADPCGGSAP